MQLAQLSSDGDLLRNVGPFEAHIIERVLQRNPFTIGHETSDPRFPVRAYATFRSVLFGSLPETWATI
jgi:hypothetical protein